MILCMCLTIIWRVYQVLLHALRAHVLSTQIVRDGRVTNFAAGGGAKLAASGASGAMPSDWSVFARPLLMAISSADAEFSRAAHLK
jgi:hypothetical protein